MSSEVDRAIEHRLSGGAHYHHKGCVHNLPPEEQVRVRGWTVEKWLAIIGPLPKQITPAHWAMDTVRACLTGWREAPGYEPR